VRIPLDPSLVTWLVYKPAGVVTTMDDPQGRPTIRSIVPAEPVTKPVGRLDRDSEGLILMTNDGDLAHVVSHPSFGVTKTYHALVPDRVTRDHVRKLTTGVDLEDGPAHALAGRIVATHRNRTIVELVMVEGRNREVRRMFEALGLDVEGLVRTAIGPLTDPTLSPGAYRRLELGEIRSLHEAAEGRDTDG
jgi:pseudouridine synthase